MRYHNPRMFGLIVDTLVKCWVMTLTNTEIHTYRTQCNTQNFTKEIKKRTLVSYVYDKLTELCLNDYQTHSAKLDNKASSCEENL